jgi:hypothetical protein
MDEEERERAEDEKNARVALKLSGYGYDEFFDDMRSRALWVELHADNETFTVEVSEETEEGRESLAVARMSRYSVRALHRAARQVRAQLEIEDLIEPWKP